MLALGEKISNAREKLSQVPEDKKERAKELLGIPPDVAAVTASISSSATESCTLVTHPRWLDKLAGFKKDGGCRLQCDHRHLCEAAT